MLSIENLRKEFNNTVAVDNISFSIEPGKIFGLLGPNGAGKTTTIRTILDIIKPTSGTIKFNNIPIDKNFQNITGYLPEERGLYKKSKVIDVINYFAELKNNHHSTSSKSIDYWLKKLEVENYKNKKVEELSKGNQQKIQFIIAVIHNPEVLILDEPFSGFDPINQEIIKEEILNFLSEGKIIILSTHQMDYAEKLCTDILLIDKGKEVCKGNINDIKKQFGSQTIKIEFIGDGALLQNLDEISHLDVYQNFAEIQLKENITPNLFLKKIIDKIEIKNFSILEPTLHKIFIDVIKKSKSEQL